MHPSRLSKVVLPEPLGPVRATASPGSIAREMSAKAVISSGPTTMINLVQIRDLQQSHQFLITCSGSLSAVFQAGTMVQARYGIIVRNARTHT